MTVITDNGNIILEFDTLKLAQYPEAVKQLPDLEMSIKSDRKPESLLLGFRDQVCMILGQFEKKEDGERYMATVRWMVNNGQAIDTDKIAVDMGGKLID